MTPLQQILFRLLRQLDAVCAELGLPYYLIGGSALGAAKYGGFIPWDDDVDVGMLRTDYEIFLERAPALLPESLFLQHYTTDPACPMAYCKLRDKGSTFAEASVAHLPMHHGVYLDVFPIDEYPQGNMAQWSLELRKKWYTYQLYAAMDIPRKPHAALANALLRLAGCHRRTQRAARKLDELGKVSSGAEIVTIHTSWHGTRERFPRQVYGAGSWGTFQGLRVRLPAHLDAYLTQKYGDWRGELPPEARKSHHVAALVELEWPAWEVLDRGKSVVFLSNYFNHHQRPLCDALYRLTGGGFRFVATGQMSQARRTLGYGQEPLPEYVVELAKDPAQVRALIRQADVVIAGAGPEGLLKRRIRRGKLVLRYQERPFKQERSIAWRLLHVPLWHWRNPVWRPIYLLCAGSPAAGDYGRVGLFRGRAYQWGYFPAASTRPREELLAGKDHGLILWCGRMIPWKHPELALETAKALKERGLSFHLELIGTGEGEPELRAQIARWDLADVVTLTGPLPPEQVRRRMERAGIFLFTSDRREGWGSVVNEAMASGCALVAMPGAGAVTDLVHQGENGLVCPSAEELVRQVARLLEHPAQQRALGAAAYETITGLWNGETAARRLLTLVRWLQTRGRCDAFPSGPCSRLEPGRGAQ